jgi:hypothetical protein
MSGSGMAISPLALALMSMGGNGGGMGGSQGGMNPVIEEMMMRQMMQGQGGVGQQQQQAPSGPTQSQPQQNSFGDRALSWLTSPFRSLSAAAPQQLLRPSSFSASPVIDPSRNMQPPIT